MLLLLRQWVHRLGNASVRGFFARQYYDLQVSDDCVWRVQLCAFTALPQLITVGGQVTTLQAVTLMLFNARPDGADAGGGAGAAGELELSLSDVSGRSRRSSSGSVVSFGLFT